jgi:hypothetical protein
MVTGESMPVSKKPGDLVIGATINTSGALLYEATKIGSDTLLSQIVELVRKAQASRAPIQKTVDTISGIFVPAVLIVAIITFAVWFSIVGAGEATPAEGTTYRLAQIDQKSFPETAHFANGIGAKAERPFYTNSTHLPVNYTDDLFELLDLQDNLQTKYTGGTVIHFFLGERADDPEALKKLIKTICENYRLPYFTFTPSFSICPVDGYLAGEHPSTRSTFLIRPVQQSTF